MPGMELYDKIQEAVAYVRSKTDFVPEVGLVLGSGLGPLADEVEKVAEIPYGEIPHFPVSTAPGHAGRLVLGRLEGKPVLVYKGRVHYYEGYSAEEVVGVTSAQYVGAGNNQSGLARILPPGWLTRGLQARTTRAREDKNEQALPGRGRCCGTVAASGGLWLVQQLHRRHEREPLSGSRQGRRDPARLRLLRSLGDR